ncbi:hypothetical protein K8B33_12120 [Alcanivorax sp. JB21]|nr:hypothetical protein [Alcanivorax limicola]MBZ2189849.1 hypothetical protein [Alcanivorax limicola]
MKKRFNEILQIQIITLSTTIKMPAGFPAGILTADGSCAVTSSNHRHKIT